MRWFINDASLQGQFADHRAFLESLGSIAALRFRYRQAADGIRVTRSLPETLATPNATVRQILVGTPDREVRSLILRWLDRAGPFIDDDRAAEEDDYFECAGREVTASGLGEAARRSKAGEDCATFSFPGGAVDFAIDPLIVHHGLAEDRLGRYEIRNLWELPELEEDLVSARDSIVDWSGLVDAAREQCPHLVIGDLHLAKALASEPFSTVIANRAMALMRVLDRYVADRDADGAVGTTGREIIQQHFSGNRASFSAESASNIEAFKDEMTFAGPDGEPVLAHFHGKISHRYFRMHFEWPLRAGQDRLAILYLGPKITKS